MARKIDKLGLHCSDTTEIYFDDVRVPQSHLIGEENKGFTYQMLQFQEERLWCVAAGKRLNVHTLHEVKDWVVGSIEYGSG